MGYCTHVPWERCLIGQMSYWTDDHWTNCHWNVQAPASCAKFIKLEPAHSVDLSEDSAGGRTHPIYNLVNPLDQRASYSHQQITVNLVFSNLFAKSCFIQERATFRKILWWYRKEQRIKLKIQKEKKRKNKKKKIFIFKSFVSFAKSWLEQERATQIWRAQSIFCVLRKILAGTGKSNTFLACTGDRFCVIRKILTGTGKSNTNLACTRFFLSFFSENPDCFERSNTNLACTGLENWQDRCRNSLSKVYCLYASSN